MSLPSTTHDPGKLSEQGLENGWRSEDRWKSDTFVLHLTDEEKLVVIVGAGAFVLLVLLLVICWVGEICPIYKCLHKSGDEKVPLSQFQGTSGQKYTSTDESDNTIFLTRRSDGASLHSKGRDSTYSSMSESGRLSPNSSLKRSKFTSSSETILEPNSNGVIKFSIQYLTNGERQIGKLNITIMEVGSLPSRAYSSSCDPFVRVTITREKRSLRGTKSHTVADFLTRTQRHSRSPVFNQSFAAEVTKPELKECVVKLVVYDEDKYGSPTELGSHTQPLRSLKRVLGTDAVQQLTQELQVTAKTFGEILFGLSYLPTAHRLSISVVRASGLMSHRVTTSARTFCPYVRAFLLTGSGRLLKKKKSVSRESDTSPVFDETIVFELGQQPVETACLLLCVFHHPPEEELHQSDEQSGEVGETRSASSRKDLCVGKVAVGKSVRGDAAVAHWLAMLQNPRKTVSQWHCLT